MSAGDRAHWVIDLLTSTNRPGLRFADGFPNGLVIHSTATPEATAKNIWDYFQNNPQVEASAHMAIDWTEARVLIPLLANPEIAWHCGHTGNHRFVGVELCESADPGKFAAMYANALEVCSTIIHFYGWVVDDLYVWSHDRVSLTFHETDHTDPIGFFASHGKTWAQFMVDLDKVVTAV